MNTGYWQVLNEKQSDETGAMHSAAKKSGSLSEARVELQRKVVHMLLSL